LGGRAVAADNIRHHQLIAAWSFAEPEHRDVELRDGGGWGGRAVLDRAEGAPRLADRVALLPSLGPDDGSSYPNIEPIVEYLTERGRIGPKLSRAQVRRRLKLATTTLPTPN